MSTCIDWADVEEADWTGPGEQRTLNVLTWRPNAWGTNHKEENRAGVLL